MSVSKKTSKNFIFGYRLARNIFYHKLGKSYPIIVAIWPTYRCNEKCIFCGNFKKHVKKELTTQEIFEIIDQMNKLSIPICAISGGEPLLREDIIEIGEYLLEKNIRNSINTNGILITKTLAKNLVKSYETIIISLDGFERTHDYIRRTRNGFKLAVGGIRYLNSVKEDNLIGINFVLNKYNYRELIPFTKTLLKKKIVDFISVQPVNYVKRLNVPVTETQALVNDLLKIKKKYPKFIRPTVTFLNKIPEFFSGEKFTCNGGRLYLTVDPSGDVLPCHCLEFTSPIGNLRNQKLKDILKSGKIKEFELRKKNCVGCLQEFTTEVSDVMNSSLLEMVKTFLTL